MQGKKIKNGNIESALNEFLKDEQHLVLGFEKGENGVRHRIFKTHLDHYSLLNPSFDTNGALYLRRLFSKGTQIILMLRPCEIRAYIELIKLNQIERQDIIAVSIDCLGALSSKEKIEGIPTEAEQLKDYFKDQDKMRWACMVCRERRGVVGDAGIRIDKNGLFRAFPYTEKGETFLALIEGELEESTAEMLIGSGENFISQRDPSDGKNNPPSPPFAKGGKGGFSGEKAGKFESDMEMFSKDFSKCIMCMNCRDMCPVCYCIDCVFNGDEYLPKGDALLNKIFRTGSAMMPQGKELFHFIRMYHVSQTCVGCGACEEACPQGIPLTKYFKGISERLQAMFSYMSGRSFDEEIPYLTFLENELKDAED